LIRSYYFINPIIWIHPYIFLNHIKSRPKKVNMRKRVFYIYGVGG